MSTYLLGIDVGTSVIKAVLFDLDGGEIASASRTVEVKAPQPGWAEQDMESVWVAAQEAIREALEQTGAAAQVAAVGIAGQGDGVWMIDAEGRPVVPAPLWRDGRAADVIDRWQASGALSRLFERGGTVLWPGTQAALLAWFSEREPGVLERVAAVLCSKDWIRFRLTGTTGTDETDGSIPFMDLASRTLASGQLEILGLASLADRLPPVQRSDDVVGSVTVAAADATGLRAGTPVVAGLLDVAANAVGVGAIEGGQAMVTLGTTALTAVVLDQPVFVPEDLAASSCHAPERRWLRILGAMAGTPNLDWYLAAMGEILGIEAARADRDVFSLLEEVVASSAPGAGGIIYHPYLLGERVPFLAPHARGAFLGLSAATTRADLARAVSEGVAYAVRHCFEAGGAPVTDVRLSGGGARSHTWSQILADVTGATMSVPAGSQFGALGAAIVAGVGVGLYTDYETAVERCVRVERVHQPSPERHARYDDRFGLYLDLIDAMRPFWPRLA
jgi:sugar (pentulose or hexulose) kinase